MLRQQEKSDSCSCANHTCSNMTNVQDCCTCSLCREPMYCSAECLQKDVGLHICDNQLEVQQPLNKRILAVPYFYEDTMSDKDISTLEVTDPVFQAYSLRYAAPNQVVQQCIIPPLIQANAISKNGTAPVSRGAEPPKWFTDTVSTFGIRLTTYSAGSAKDGRSVFWEGLVPRDLIYAKNQNNATARKLGGFTVRGLGAGQKHIIFWPPAMDSLTCDLRSEINVDLFLGRTGEDVWRENPDVFIHTGVAMDAMSSKNRLAALGRRAREAFSIPLRIKFGSKQNIEGYKVLRFGDVENDGVHLTFEMIPGSKQMRLVDVELLVELGKLQQMLAPVMSSSSEIGDDVSHDKPKILEQRYHCNPSNFNHVAGLVMSLNQTLSVHGQTPALTDEDEHRLRDCCSIITKYAHEMDENNGVSPYKVVPVHVQSAINTAMDIQYPLIGVQLNVDYWNRKMLGSYGKVAREINKVIQRMETARKDAIDGNVGQRTKAKVIRSTTLRTLQNINTALSTFISRLNDPDLPDCSEVVVAQYRELQQRVTEAMRG